MIGNSDKESMGVIVAADAASVPDGSKNDQTEAV